jgi:hypothetical protein
MCCKDANRLYKHAKGLAAVLHLQVLGDLPVDALPGVGWALKGRLAELGITQCRQVGVLQFKCAICSKQYSSDEHLV